MYFLDQTSVPEEGFIALSYRRSLNGVCHGSCYFVSDVSPKIPKEK